MNYCKIDHFIIRILSIILIFFANYSYSQSIDLTYQEFNLDKCAYDEHQAMEMLEELGPGWGYNYDSLLYDLNRWRFSPFIIIDSVGASVQNRALYLLTITDTTQAINPRFRISIHARTHPSEVQSTWVTNEIIKLLLSDTPTAQILRHNCIFNIMPLYNPDGVELGYGRENANHVDLERNWDTDYQEPEAATLKRLFLEFMSSESPIRIALNMHSSSLCKRYFVYHHQNGTSAAYAEDEKFFIRSIRNFWSDGVEDWDYYISWKTGTPTYYPESWFWINFRESVMALTYEDMACTSAGEFDRTAAAMLNGIADYLGLRNNTNVSSIHITPEIPTDFASIQTYPNPILHGHITNIRVMLMQRTKFDLKLYDILGRERNHLISGLFEPGNHDLRFMLPGLSNGVYFIKLRSNLGILTVPITIRH